MRDNTNMKSLPANFPGFGLWPEDQTADEFYRAVFLLPRVTLCTSWGAKVSGHILCGACSTASMGAAQKDKLHALFPWPLGTAAWGLARMGGAGFYVTAQAGGWVVWSFLLTVFAS